MVHEILIKSFIGRTLRNVAINILKCSIKKKKNDYLSSKNSKICSITRTTIFNVKIKFVCYFSVPAQDANLTHETWFTLRGEQRRRESANVRENQERTRRSSSFELGWLHLQFYVEPGQKTYPYLTYPSAFNLTRPCQIFFLHITFTSIYSFQLPALKQLKNNREEEKKEERKGKKKCIKKI